MGLARIIIALLLFQAWALTHAAPGKPESPAITQQLDDKALRVCGDNGEWPPFAFYSRDSHQDSAVVVGYSVEVLKAVFEHHDIGVEVELVPWKRCLREVARGGRFHALIDATLNEQRARRFLVSRPYYHTRPYYFYSSRHFPDGLAIQSPEQLRQYRVCGLLGYNYVIYGVGRDAVDTTTRNFSDLIAKLHRKRCDLFIEQFEIMAGFRFTNEPDYLADMDLTYAPLPYTDPVPFHMMFPRDPLGRALKQLVDQRLETLERSGRLDALLQRYMREVALQSGLANPNTAE